MQRPWADRPLGMRDIYPEEARRRRDLENHLLAYFERHGFAQVSSGALEYVDSLLRGRPSSQAAAWIQWFDMSGRAIALRPDMTPAIARMAAPAVGRGRIPIRWCYAERVYHRPADPALVTWSSGRPVEWTQVGVEWIGERGTDVDCSLLELCQGALASLALQGCQTVVGHAGFTPAFLEAAGIAPDEVKPLLDLLAEGDYVGFRTQAARAGADTDMLAALSRLDPFTGIRLVEALGGRWRMDAPGAAAAEAAWRELVSLAEALRRRGLEAAISFDLSLYRSLPYYTGIIFEVFAPGVGAPIGYGGRYDGLLAHYGADAPAVGFSFEAERLLTALGEGEG
ncbi:ATP phosphoribosyltransferase regulatory subunit [Alicyclobacillus cellulosilyticus]|uniref:ATP phosphoribosyltransferase regulatory subunit n=1 Tax=Alicyclobacillus cellulosilyticus TaxID=1003997 RepID=A0A917NJ33_9BACL|nr:ATP phosphoribosyltransferase regulatory subunit [Alicyclobacillus cellulosilyticus]GGJ01526.1 ATP phosphoribosyltransferase regulatory subunit [Alicyclobacillus cellulosilyticus]